MTPPALDRDVVHLKLRAVRELLDDLDSLPGLTVQQLDRERLLRHAVERILTQLVELAAGINSHVAAALLGAGPVTYRESFGLAARAGVLSEELAGRLAPSAGMRDVLVHEYVEVQFDQIVAGTARARTDYRDYVASVADFLSR